MSKPTALGANIFAGTFTKGVEQAGFQVLGHLEHGPYGVATARLNFPKLEVRVGREHWKETDYKGKVDFMFCNPPCAAWSNAAQRKGSGDHKSQRGSWETQVDRLRCVYDCVEAGVAVRPKAWCWESVTAAWEHGRTFVTEQAERWCDAGYHCTLLLQDNQFLGAAQRRHRMFLIAHKHPLVWPKLTETTTVAEALKHARKRLPSDPPRKMLSPMRARLWRYAKDHGGYLTAAFQAEGRGGLEGGKPINTERRLPLDVAAPVMIGADKRLHPTEPRWFDYAEWLELCGLPKDWQTACGNMNAAGAEMSRAVLAPVGRWLATAVKEGLKCPSLKTRPSLTLVDLRKPDYPTQAKLWDYGGPTVKRTVPPPLNAPKAPRPPKPCDACQGAKKVKALKGRGLVDCAACAGTGIRPPKVAQRKPCRVCEGLKVVGKKACEACRGTGQRLPRDPSKPGSGERIREMLMNGMGAQEILAVIHKEFPQSRATGSDVSWNKMKLRTMGKAVPGDGVRPARKVVGSKAAPPKAKVAVPAANAVTFGRAVNW